MSKLYLLSDMYSYITVYILVCIVCIFTYVFFAYIKYKKITGAIWSQFIIQSSTSFVHLSTKKRRHFPSKNLLRFYLSNKENRVECRFIYFVTKLGENNSEF